MGISRKAFEEQVLALLGSLNGVARRLTANPTDAEDLVAETVARAWRALDSLESEAAFRAWIFRILHNTFVSELRRAGARPRLESLECDEADEEEVPFSIFEQMHQPFLLWFSNPEQAFVDKLLRQDLDRALASLPDCHRVVVILSDLEGMSYGEIAETLGIPVGTVRSRLARARGALQKILWQQAREYGLPASRQGREGSKDTPRQATADARVREEKGSIR
ncbi:MAG TPA: sigma-70 family RNA polymerase sigma factor [Burkholderiales bacterium]|nr:sigma-70 family RNA polymerase sigma factor [Burkholderiales bacterium]